MKSHQFDTINIVVTDIILEIEIIKYFSVYYICQFILFSKFSEYFMSAFHSIHVNYMNGYVIL